MGIFDDLNEERRLFYVALTRARYSCHLIVQSQASTFIDELLNEKEGIIYNDIVKNEDHFPCPRCDGHLVKIQGPDDDFYGCSNYPYCDYTASKNINLSQICPECGDYMIKKYGPYGSFWGCNSYAETQCHGKKIDKS